MVVVHVDDQEEESLESSDPHSLNSLLFDSSIHGVKYLSQRDRPAWERTVWLALIIASGCASAYFVHGIVHQYYDSPVIVSFQTTQTSIAQIPFPAVSVCNINRFRKSAFFELIDSVQKLRNEKAKAVQANDTEAVESITRQLLLTAKLLRGFDNVCLATTSFHAQLNYSINETTANLMKRGIELEYDAKIDMIDMYDVGFKELLRQSRIEQTCDEMILLCMWEGEPISCNKSFSYRWTRYGTCCTFNMVPRYLLEEPYYTWHKALSEVQTPEDKEWETFNFDSHIVIDDDNVEDSERRKYPRRQSKAGQRSGLSFLVNPESDEYYCGGNSGYGFRILSHSVLETAKVKDFGLAVGPGEEVFMDVLADLTLADDSIRDLSPKTRYCYFSHEQPLDSFLFYTQNNCIDECIANLVLANCSCLRFDLPVPKTVELSTPLCEGESLKCSKAIRAEIFQLAGNTEDLNKTFCKTCFPSCQKIDYNTQTSTLPLRVDPRIWTNDKNETASWANEKVSIVHVYFGSDNVYSRVRKKLYGANDLIANIGGILGLFLGLSIIGIIEPIYYMIKLVYFKLTHAHKTKN